MTDRNPFPAPAEGRPDRRSRVEARRRHLATVAIKLIYQRGFESLSVNELAQAAGMSVGGMYRYIRTKSDVLVMACEDVYGGLREQLVEAAAAEDSVEDSLRAAVQLYLESSNAARDRILLMYREYRHLPPDAHQRFMAREVAVVNVFGDLVRQGIAQGKFPPADPSLIAHDIVMLGHLPALKGWALRDRDAATVIEDQREAILGLITGRRPVLESTTGTSRRLPASSTRNRKRPPLEGSA